MSDDEDIEHESTVSHSYEDEHGDDDELDWINLLIAAELGGEG